MMSQSEILVLASSNHNKVREIRQELSALLLKIIGLAELGPIDKPDEDGASFAENARMKALYYARATDRWCLADDSGLEVDALGGAPGVRSARYAAQQCALGADHTAIDRANNARLLLELTGVPADGLAARFVCHIVLADPKRVLIETFDVLEGLITERPRGENGFGYDPIFYLPGRDKTLAQLSTQEKNRISHRGKALRYFTRLLQSLLASRASKA